MNISQQISWDPSRFVGFSADQVALIKVGFEAALNDAYAIETRMPLSGCEVGTRITPNETRDEPWCETCMGFHLPCGAWTPSSSSKSEQAYHGDRR